MTRLEITQKTATLDPQQNAIEICHLLAGYEFPWDMTRSLELALLRTFCVPSISALLDRTGEFHHHGQKRYDDTGLIVSAVLKWGYDSPEGMAFIQRMNAIHAYYAIGNEDFLYVLSTFIYEPIRWCDRFGWRVMNSNEKQAMYYFWRSVGDRMGLSDIPPSYEAFEQFSVNYETIHFRYSEANARVATATQQIFLNWFPAFLHPILKPGTTALLDEPMRSALGWNKAPDRLTRLIEVSLKLRSRLLRKLPPRNTADFFIDQSQRSYPQGVQFEQIGPPSLIDRLNASDRPSD